MGACPSPVAEKFKCRRRSFIELAGGHRRRSQDICPFIQFHSSPPLFFLDSEKGQGKKTFEREDTNATAEDGTIAAAAVAAGHQPFPFPRNFCIADAWAPNLNEFFFWESGNGKCCL
jgi:hypothetical protein